ncbi:MAG: Gfo/Idh/MocA family oxidoreductase [Phycisphaeraceae bacterium]
MSTSRTAAIIGCGKARQGKEGFAIGHAHAKGYLHGMPDIKLHAVDPDDDNRKAFGETFELPSDQLFPSTTALYEALTPEVVSICTWPRLHRPQVIEAAQTGVKGIICEKPMALDNTEVDKMLAACREHGTKLAIAHQRAYDGVFVKLRELLHGGAIGDGWCAEMRVGDGWDMLSWSVHWMDLVSWLFDAQPEWVLAGIDHSGARRYEHAIEDNSVVLAQYPQGRQAIFVTGPDLPDGRMVQVRGRDGMIAMEDGKLSVFNRDGFTVHEPAPVDKPGFAGLIANMFETIDNGAPLRVDAERSANATRMAWAAHESARSMRRVPVPADVHFAPLEVVQRAPRPGSLGRVVLLADNHHADPVTGEGGREGLAEAVRAIGAESVEVIKAEQHSIEPGDLQGADLLLLYHTQRASTPAARQAIGGWVEAGKPLGIVHCGIGAYADWPTFRQWMGRHWVWRGEPGMQPSGHPHEPCEIEVTSPERFDPGWATAWLPRDEVYVQLHEAAPVHELAVGRISTGQQPIAWQSVAQPNVAVWAPGHRRDVWQLPAMRTGLAATVNLVRAAGRAATAV